MHSKLTKYISIILAIVMIASLMPGYQPAARAEAEELAGRTLSILGASISTYAGTSNGDAADTTNSTIRSNAKYYPNATVNDVTLEDTWWMQAADDLGLRLLVNNSWSGSALLHTRSGTVGAYVERCVQLHDDTGDNAGELPDIIAIQMGTNDFQYYKDTLGTADIDYAALIAANDDGTYTYAEPVTSLEAAAIVLHKIGVRYPDAEVYYLNISQRVDDTDELIRSFNAELKQVVEHFGAHIVDIYGSAITMADFDKYIGDGRAHPNKLGMDAYTEAFKEALLANTAYEAEYHKVSMNLTDVAADYGTDRLVPDGEAFEVKLSAAANDAIEVKVTMGGRDITADAYKSGTVTIGAVTDDVLITAAGVHSLKSYRWEFDGGELACVSGGNALTKNAGTTTDGVFSKTRYALKEAVVLNHDEAWAVEWKCEGTWQNSESSSGARVFTTTDVNADYNARYIFKSNTNGLIAMGEKDTKGSHNYGIALGDHDIDWTALHTYRLENRIADDGSNMIYLSVDGEEIGAMTGYYIGTKSQKTDSEWLNGKDFVFPYMGTDTHGFTNCSIEYIAVCEGDTAHGYTPTVTLPTCTAQGYTTYTCTSCGDVYRTAWLDAAAYEGKTIACIGDSITCGVGVTKDETDYVYLLAEQLGMNYIRLGVSGTTLCTDGSRTCNISKLTEGNLNGADVVTIAMGINDFCAAAKGYYELGDINSTDSSTIYGAARMWCERIEELRKTDSLSDTQFYFVTPVIASWNSSVTSSRNWDQSKVNVHGYTLRDLCNAIIEVAALYDVPVIDLNLTSGMYYVSATDNNTAAFGGDGVHPGPNGHAMMADALANALLQNDLRSDHAHTYGSWITTKYPGCANGEEKRVCSVCTATESRVLNGTGHSYSSVVTDPTCVEQGYTTHTCECGDSYVDSYVSATGEHSYSGLTCTVCGAERETAYAYYWQNDGTNLNSITQKDTAENDLTLLQGSVRNGVLTNTQFSLENAIVLCHDQPWVIEWRSQGNWKGMLFASSRQSPSDGLTYLFQDTATRLFAFGEYDGLWHNYGIVLDCDMSLFHTFRLENRITEDGSNAVYLLIDNHEIGAMHHYYVTNKNQNQTVNWANGKDLVFSNMGTSTHAVSDMQLDYLRVWEGGHEHAYQSAVTAPSCVDAGYTTYTGTQCGCSFMDGYLSPTGHELFGWIRISGSTCADGGEERRECGKCDYSETRTIEHRYEAVITPPTCTAQGYTTYTCSECGSSRTGDVTGIPVDRNINFVGMSIWYFDGKVLPEWGTGGGEVARGFQTLLKEHFAFRSTKDYCYSGYSLGALSGSDSHSIAANIESCVRTGEAGDIWTLDTNTNDFKRDIPIGTIEDYMNSTGAATFYGALRVFHDRVTELSGENVVVICSNAIRRNTSGYTSTSANACGHTLADYEAAVKTVALHNGWYFVDQFNDSGITEENLSEVTIDGLHPNNEGYKLAVRPWIEQISRFAHTYESAVTAPTCTEQGYTTYTCAECGDSYAADYTEPRPLNILMIGNSFSWDAADFWYDMQESMTYDAMKNMLADSYDVHLAVMYKGSATLAYHATCAMNNTAAYTYTEIGPETNYKWTPASGNNATNSILERLEAREWDIIVIQSYQHEADGTEPRSTYTGGDSRFVEPEASTGYLLDYFAEHEPNAEIYYYMPWASTKFYGNDTEAGYRAIAEYSKNRVPEFKGTNSGKQFAGIIPVGTGIQNARTTYFDELRFSSGTGSTALLQDPQNGLQYDSQHLSFGLGRYIAGIVVAETLIPQAMRVTSYTLPAVKDSPSVGALPQEYSAIAQLAAEKAVSHPYQITALNGYETDLADRICEAIETGDYVSEEIADEAALAEYLQSVVDAYLENAGAAESEITIHSFVLENGRIKELDAGIALRVGYTKRTARINVVDGQSHRFGDWIHVTAPTANEVGIDSRTCAACGFTQIVEVEGSWQKYNLAEHLQELPEKFCHKTNLWAELEPESLMIDHLGKWVSAGATVYSVTIPIAPGDKIYANSFDVTGTKKGIQVSFIGNYGIVKTTFSSGTHEEFCENGGYLIAPEGAIAVNIPVWNVNADDNVINILNAEHIYDVNVTPPTCTQQGYTTYTCACGDSYVADYVDELGHTPGEAVKENETAGGAHDSVVYCTECGNELSREHVEGETHTPGDINGDGSVNNKDFTRLFQYLADWDVEVVEAALDVNGDGTVNNKDLTRLFQYLSDWDVVIH